ncbi:lamin tail domain-containing protein [Akkermansiaceae bacterium]|nr:lamin tail domain-containing protein [Akkermansiaceae bacterium]
MVLTLLATVCSLEAQRVVISEIHFDRAEFLEFYNPGETDVDLTGYTVIGGIDVFLVGTIPPKKRAVIVGDLIRFRQEHRLNEIQILAEYERRLDNDGEEIALRDPNGQVILRLEYRAKIIRGIPEFEAWPPDPHRREHALVYSHPDDPALSPNDGANWHRAFRENGTPGSDSDTDRDGLDDHWERFHFDSLQSLPSDDPDGDTLDNFTEHRLFTNPVSEDTDRDGLTDLQETSTGRFISLQDTGTRPYDSDSDGDGLLDGQEVPIDTPPEAFPTDPNHSDTDGDSHLDGDEINFLGDPLDPLIFPRAPEIAFFRPEHPEIRAGQPIKLTWEINGSSSLHIDSPQEGPVRMSTLSSGRKFLPSSRTELIPPDQTWKYDLSSEDFGTAWTSPDFEDSTWPTGGTPFIGFDTLNERPEISTRLHNAESSPYFRTTFDLADVIPSQRIVAKWSVESAGALFINNRLIRKVGLPTEFTRETRASADQIENIFSPEIFGGRQHIAASSHYPQGLFAWRFSRLYFDLSLQQIDPVIGPQTYSLTATNPYGTTQKTITVNILDDLPPIQTYPQWSLNTFPNDEAVQTDQADPDRDGISNLMEFLTVSDPRVPDADPLTITPVYYPVSDNPNNSGKFAWYEASFHRHRNPGNAIIHLETSEDLINWTPLPTLFNPSKTFEPTIEVIDGQREKLTYRIYRNRKPKFMRLRALTSP